MIKPIHFILHALQGNINLDGVDVRLIQAPPRYDNIPCVTIDDSGGTSILEKRYTNKDLPLPVTHPQYDPNHPDKLFSQQIIREKRGVNLDLNIWCNTEDERESIITQIRTLFYLVQSDNYRFCKNYNKTTCKCSKLDSVCPTSQLTTGHMRGTKGQCMDPTRYGYANPFTMYDIVRASFDVAPAYNLDNLEDSEPTLRSIIRVSCDYYDYHVIGGIISEELTNLTI